jgi:predicted esterase
LCLRCKHRAALVLALLSASACRPIAATEHDAAPPPAKAPPAPPAFTLQTLDRPPLASVRVWAPPPGSGGRYETLLLLHGNQGDPPDPTWMAELREQPGFARRILIVPALAGGEYDWADARNTRAVAALVEEIARDLPVDRDALYLVGYSAGASRVLDVAWRLPKLAGIAALAGDVVRALRDRHREWRVLAPKLLLLCMRDDPGPHTSCALNRENQKLLAKHHVAGISLQVVAGDHQLDLSTVAPLIDDWIRGR